MAQAAQEICKSLFSDLVERNSSNPFSHCRKGFDGVHYHRPRQEWRRPDNRDIKDYIDSASIEDLRELLASHKEFASVASYIGGKAGAQAQGVLSEMYSVVRDIFTGVFADSGDFSMR